MTEDCIQFPGIEPFPVGNLSQENFHEKFDQLMVHLIKSELRKPIPKRKQKDEVNNNGE